MSTLKKKPNLLIQNIDISKKRGGGATPPLNLTVPGQMCGHKYFLYQLESLQILSIHSILLLIEGLVMPKSSECCKTSVCSNQP